MARPEANSWAVGLVGEPWQLGEVAPHLPELVRSSQDGDGWELVSPRFEQETEAQRILDLAREVVAMVNGITRIRLDRPSRIQVGNVRRYRADGTKDVWVFPEPIRLRLRMGTPTILVNGMPVNPTSWVPDLDAASSDSNVRAVLLFLDLEPTWHSLYAGMETILKDRRTGGTQGVFRWSGVTATELKRFTRTANSFLAVGTQARHGPRFAPPRVPMTLDEGTEFVRRVVDAWLHEVARSAGSGRGS